MTDTIALVGFPERADDVYNACAVLAGGRVQAVYRKVYLPNYGVFDEQRYFQAGDQGALLALGETTIGLTICEDIWEPGPPASDEANAGATLIVNLSASPYHAGKGSERERMLIQRARDNVAAFAFCNLVGGQDELVFDGHSLVIDHEGTVIARGRQFEEELILATIDPAASRGTRLRDPRHRPVTHRARPDVPLIATLSPAPLEPGVTAAVGGPVNPPLGEVAEVYAALVLGLRDYVEKNGFGHVVIGLSGGIDSALVATIAVDALGAERVSVVVMPSPYSSDATQGDARALAANLGADLRELPIAPMMSAYDGALAEVFAGREPDLTEENLQARIRGNLLMALSNKFGWLVLTTGNKSEMAVGYSTLYGDSAGGFAVIKDVPQDARVRARRATAPIRTAPSRPRSSTAPPSAELRADQLRLRLAAALRDPRPHPGRLRRGRSRSRRARPARLRRARRRAGHRARGSCRVQAPSGSAGHQDLHACLRPRPPRADHQPLRRLGALRRAGRVGRSAGGVADGDRHPREHAQAAGVVGDLHLPDPGGAPAVHGAGLGVDRAGGDRAQEAGQVGQPHRHLAVGHHGQRRFPGWPGSRPSMRRRRRGRGRRAAAARRGRPPARGPGRPAPR